jgi:hypothetical protein
VKAIMIPGAALAATLTTTATFVIFTERFLDGAWTYFVLIPALYAFFTYFHIRLGAPEAVIEY